ncbi:ethanolamine ammonia-lyase subunit EutC [Hydrogenophaga sp.]|uniref:ethanolamine ammonia-lyase subunit EutC n=1 Tax=Hydrogenophaga sp. TaxID=1904254 RepID=UPI00271637D9|nr:ethanolamine ammonia-lyase subunit EutC [Hydrogenophaga sp.]MDO8905804.1 ethanolamine ammonia-lyase subunit EutC [Hydrogenophaga sp.]
MNKVPTATVTPALWRGLRRFTDARIALGRAGVSQPTAAHLAFQLAHAQARDAVHLPFDPTQLTEPLHALGLQALQLHSAAPDRITYLQRPDLGRRLDAGSVQTLQNWQQDQGTDTPPDLAFVIADGLSAHAAMQHALPLMTNLVKRLREDDTHRWTLAPVALVEQGRVAIGDEIGALLHARTVVVLIGERPGLSSPDSLGIYFTWAPRVGLSDAQRNCISNVRDAGLPPERAAGKLMALLRQARLRQITGIALKDEVDERLDPPLSGPQRLRP